MKLLQRTHDKEFWTAVKEKDCYRKAKNEIHVLWNKLCTIEIEPLKYSDFKRYWVTGDRAIYERVYFDRRLALDASALMSLMYPEEEKYLIKLMDLIYAVCDEYTWCLPAHQKILETNNNSKIDLFASETGFALAEIYTMLEDRLEPLIKDRIKTEIVRRIITPYTQKQPYDWWETSGSNWNAVCNGSVACTVMLLFPEMFDSLKERFDNAFEYYLDGFKNDGICAEGCGYWHYGFGFFVVYADMVRSFTNGQTDYFKREKVKTVSAFIQKMFLSENVSVSFADGGMSLNYHLGLLHYLKNEYPDSIVVYNPKYSYNYDGCARFCLQLRSLLWLDENLYTSFEKNTEKEHFAPDTQWFVKTTKNYGFAAKGGHNDELHNQNDVGSFIFAKNGRQQLMDIGAGIYTRQYFSKERYTILECSSRGHSLPIINGALQKNGKMYAAKDTRYENGVFSTDISGAYEIKELRSLVRSFSFTDESVKIKDVFDLNEKCEITERFVTLTEPNVKDNSVIVGDAIISFDPSVCSLKINNETREQKDVCYFIDFTLNDGINEFEITVK